MIEDVVQDRVDAGVVSVIATLDRSLITRRGNAAVNTKAGKKLQAPTFKLQGPHGG